MNLNQNFKPKEIKIFLSSPIDAKEIVNNAIKIIEKVNNSSEFHNKIKLNNFYWEKDTYPALSRTSGDAQSVINDQIGDFRNYDIFIGILWKRIGTKTRRAESGTIEEFDNALKSFYEFGNPEIMIYFCQEPFYDIRESEIEQFKKVALFQKRVQFLGLYHPFNEIEDFPKIFEVHLSSIIRKLIKSQENKSFKSSFEDHLDVSKYHGITLKRCDFEFLKDLENIIREPIPYYRRNDVYQSNFEFLEFGFMIRNERIVKLGLSGINIIKLPISIGNLSKLQVLDLHNNQLSSLPFSFDKLIDLESLDISQNGFIQYPLVLKGLKKLDNVNIIDNRNSMVSPMANISS